MPDVTDVPGVTTGEPVTVGPGGITADDLAGWCNTITYEILNSIRKRVPRTYVEACDAR